MVRNNELIRVAKKAADAWRNTDAYYQAAQIIDMLLEELESDTLTQPNEPLPLEQLREMDVEKVWRGEWVGVPSMGVYDTVCSKCGYCPGIRFWSSDFCPHCGAPMTDEAVETIMKRMEEMRND